MCFCVSLVAKQDSLDLAVINFVASLGPLEIPYTVSHHFMENVKLSNKRISLTFDTTRQLSCDAMEGVLWSPSGPAQVAHYRHTVNDNSTVLRPYIVEQPRPLFAE